MVLKEFYEFFNKLCTEFKGRENEGKLGICAIIQIRNEIDAIFEFHDLMKYLVNGFRIVVRTIPVPTISVIKPPVITLKPVRTFIPSLSDEKPSTFTLRLYAYTIESVDVNKLCFVGSLKFIDLTITDAERIDKAVEVTRNYLTIDKLINILKNPLYEIESFADMLINEFKNIGLKVWIEEKCEFRNCLDYAWFEYFRFGEYFKTLIEYAKYKTIITHVVTNILLLIKMY